MMGNKTEKVITRSGKGFFMENRSESYQARALMTPGEVRVLPYEKILLLLSGKNPVKGNKIFWFKHKKFKDNADYNIPYPSYLRFVDKLINQGVTEYAAEYLIYLTKSYKALKLVINELGEDLFVEEILKNEDLSKEEKRILTLKREEIIELKKNILDKLIKKENYLTKEEYEKEYSEYLADFTNEDLIKYLKTEFFRKQDLLEKTLSFNLERLKNQLNKKEQIKLDIIEHLKEKNILDSWIPQIPKTFIERILELEIDRKKITEVLDKEIEKEEEGTPVQFDFLKLEKELENSKINQKLEENSLEIEEI